MAERRLLHGRLPPHGRLPKGRSRGIWRWIFPLFNASGVRHFTLSLNFKLKSFQLINRLVKRSKNEGRTEKANFVLPQKANLLRGGEIGGDGDFVWEGAKVEKCGLFSEASLGC